MAKLYRFKVAGNGVFPVDMLRYDAAWPSTTEDAVKLMGKDERSVWLASIQLPTLARWASFGWRVTSAVKA